MAATGHATTQSAIQQQQQQQPGNDMQAAFNAMHGELLAEAHAVATELGADVHTVAFLPDGGGGGGDGAQPQAVAHEFIGNPRRMMRRLVARDVSRMGAAELSQHAARLRALRAAVMRKLREKEERQTAAAAAVGGEGSVKRAPEQQETLAGAGGFTKIRRD